MAILRAAGRAHMSATTRRTRAENSRGRLRSRAVPRLEAPVRLGFLACGAVGAVLLIVADFSTLYEVSAITAVVKRVSAGSQHTYALVVLGLFAGAMVWGVATGRSRPAMFALAAIGVIVALIVLIGDLHNVSRAGVIGKYYSNAKASPKSGFYLETLGSALLLISGGGLLVLTAPRLAVRTVAEPAEEAERPSVVAEPAREPQPEPGTEPEPEPQGEPQRRRQRPAGQQRQKRQPRSQTERDTAAKKRAAARAARAKRGKAEPTAGQTEAAPPAEREPPAPPEDPEQTQPQDAPPEPPERAPAQTAFDAAQTARRAAGRALRRRLRERTERKQPPEG